jgi:predicted nuclease with TOPRIM domain
MTPYLIGGGLVTGLLGVIVGLWYRYKYARTKGKLDGLGKDHKALNEKYDKALEDHESEIKNKDAEINGLRGNEELLSEKVRVLLASCADPVALNDELNSLFPVPKEEDG